MSMSLDRDSLEKFENLEILEICQSVENRGILSLTKFLESCPFFPGIFGFKRKPLSKKETLSGIFFAKVVVRRCAGW